VTDAAVAALHDRVARLWLATLHEIARRAAHEVKNALNGVAVNLEVVRGRLSRPGATADGAVRFATTASEQFERVSAFAEALLALSRPARAPADVGAQLHTLRTLLAVGALGDGAGALRPGDGVSGADAEVARLVLGAALLATAGDGGAGPAAAAVLADGGVRVRLAGVAPALDPQVAGVARDAGIDVDLGADGITLTFPPLRADRSAIRSA
jgi:hypothetical protein